jgi:glycosyltransferase involved in cell wall biosynthesis
MKPPPQQNIEFNQRESGGAPLSPWRGDGGEGCILFYSPQSLPSIGGLQYVVHYWAAGLTKKGYAITLLTETEGDTGHDKLQPYRVDRNAGWWAQVKVIRQAGCLIMFNVSLKGLPAWLMASILSILSGKGVIPLYLSHHTALWYDNGPRPWRQRLKRWIANNLAAKNCACSNYIASLYKNCATIYSPYRNDVFVPGHETPVPGSILFVGRLVSDKGVDLLLQACGILKNQGVSFQLTIAGDGPDRQKLEEFTLPPPPRSPRQSGIAVKWSGSVSQSALIQLMQTHQIMVVPSRMEPMGMVVAEGLACGCRMVVSNQGGLPEVGGPFCRYFETGNVESLAATLKVALENPLEIDSAKLENHLEKFTVDYAIRRLEEWIHTPSPPSPLPMGARGAPV